MKLPGFVGPSYQMDAVSFDHQRSVNLFPIASESGSSKSVSALRITAGIEEFAQVGGGPIRGCIEADGRSFWVSGGDFYEVDGDGVATLWGSLLTATSRCTLNYNGTQIMVIDGTYGYIFTLDTNVFEQILDADFPFPAAYGTFQDNYFIVTKGGTAQFYISAIGDGLSWDVLDFTSVESAPDDLVCCISDGTNLWALGRTTVEVFQNTGAAAFPFERIPGAVIQSGCAAPFSAIIFDNALTWLGQDDRGGAIVWRANGYQATRISTQAIERKIATSSNPVESYAYTYYEQGHSFYCLQVKGVNSTLCCDAATGNMWHEKSYRNKVTNQDEQHRATCHVYFNNQNLVGDRELGIVYNQSLDIYSDNGDEIIRVRISPHIQDEKMIIRFSVFELDIEAGRALQAGQGSDPMMMMKYSDDGGFTWSNERWVSIGRVGKYIQRARWTRCGSARDRVWWVSFSDPIFTQINEAYINTL
jgi:Phage stabilisation protein